MLVSVWDRPTGGSYAPEFRQGVRVGLVGGVIDYDVPAGWLTATQTQEVAGAQ